MGLHDLCEKSLPFYTLGRGITVKWEFVSEIEALEGPKKRVFIKFKAARQNGFIVTFFIYLDKLGEFNYSAFPYQDQETGELLLVR